LDDQGGVLDLKILGEVEMIEIGSQIIFPGHIVSVVKRKIQMITLRCSRNL
jgi:hypothetical protein